jgi:hypothetical protein
MAVQLALRSSADVWPYFVTNQANISQKNGVGVFHPDLFIRLFEGDWDKVKERINEGGVHVDDVVVLLECHAVYDFDVGTIIGVGASTAVGYICNFRGKWIVHIRVCLATRMVSVEGGINGNV